MSPQSISFDEPDLCQAIELNVLTEMSTAKRVNLTSQLEGPVEMLSQPLMD